MICNKCKQDIEKDEFPRNRKTCRNCINQYHRDYYAKNSERILAQERKRQPEITKKKAEWRNKNRKHIREYMRIYMKEYIRGFRRKEHPFAVREPHKKPL